jgi:hypothetical protein
VSDTAGVSSPTPSQKSSDAASNRRGPVFGVGLQEIPPLAMAISIIGGQRHQLPILVFSLVEAIFKRGKLLLYNAVVYVSPVSLLRSGHFGHFPHERKRRIRAETGRMLQ